MSSRERESAYRCEFRARKRLRGESVSEYGFALNRLANRAFPNIPLANLENLVVDQYISGFGNLELKKYVQFSHPSTLDKAISLAVEFEAFDSTHRSINKPHNPEFMRGPPVMALQNRENRADQKSLSETEILLSDMNKAIKELQSAISEIKSNQVTNRQSTIKCYTCGQPGHTSRQCSQGSKHNSRRGDKSKQKSKSENNPNMTGLSLRPEVQSSQC